MKKHPPIEPSYRPSSDLDVADILSMCARSAIPVNTRSDIAIAAHQTAFAAYLVAGAPATGESFDLATSTLRAVVLAWAPTLDDDRARLAYLGGLPMTAWCSWRKHSAESIRQETLKAAEHHLRFVEGL